VAGGAVAAASGGADRCDDGGTGRTACDGGYCFGAVLEWFWEYKIYGQNTENNVWKMMNSFYYLRNKKNKMP